MNISLFRQSIDNKDVLGMLLSLEKAVGINGTYDALEGDTPLTYATDALDLLAIERLISLGADLSLSSEFGEVPFLRCASQVQESPTEVIAIIKYMLKNGADVNITSYKGLSALHYAAEAGNEEFISLLLSHGADANAVEWPSGQTPLHFACMETRSRIAKLLIKNGARLNEQTIKGWTPLHFASLNGCADIVMMLLDRGVDTTLTTTDGRTASDFARTKRIKDLILKKQNDTLGVHTLEQG